MADREMAHARVEVSLSGFREQGSNNRWPLRVAVTPLLTDIGLVQGTSVIRFCGPGFTVPTDST